MKTPTAFNDDSTHYLKIHICELEKDSKDVTTSVNSYFFVLGFSGCENGYVTWNNCQSDCWDYSDKERRNDINFHIKITIDDVEVVLDDYMMLELEFE
jgi:hypothetical protein